MKEFMAERYSKNDSGILRSVRTPQACRDLRCLYLLTYQESLLVRGKAGNL